MQHYFNTCPRCGDNLDPGEKCDCEVVTSPIKAIKTKSGVDNGSKMSRVKQPQKVLKIAI